MSVSLPGYCLVLQNQLTVAGHVFASAYHMHITSLDLERRISGDQIPNERSQREYLPPPNAAGKV